VNTPLKVCCIGTGDAFGSGGRLNSCFHLAAGNEQLLLDCGCSSLIGLQRSGIDPAGIDTVVISHLHGDHFGGIPFLLLEGKFVSQRKRPLTLIGPPGLQQQVEEALEALYPGAIGKEVDFPVIYRQLEPEEMLQQGSFRIGCCQVKHGSSPHVFALRIETAGKSLCYSGDTEWTDNLIPLVSGSDLFIAECFAYEQPTPSHLDYRTLLAKRGQLACQRLVLTHLGKEMLEKIPDLELDVVNDGDLISL
jgi:ribonuclease BN (tRNA processing enzyme)